MDAQKIKLKKMLMVERAKIKDYEAIAKVHSAYISILLKRLGATEKNPEVITKDEIKEALEHYEARGIPDEDSYSLYCEVIDNDGVQADDKSVEGKKKD